MTGLVDGVKDQEYWLGNIVAWTGLLPATRDERRWSSATHTRSQPSLRDDSFLTRHGRGPQRTVACRNGRDGESLNL